MRLSVSEFARTAAATAMHFGFKPLERAAHEVGPAGAKKPAPRILAADRREDGMQGLLTAGAALYFERNLSAREGPALFFTINTVPRSSDIALGLHVIGVEKSIAEALLIETVRSLFAELELPQPYLRINSLGDRDSNARYARELGNFLRKRAADLPPAARELLKTRVMEALALLLEKEHEVSVHAPNPLEFLSDASRRHFRDIVEYLDLSGAEYEIDPHLIGQHACYSGTLFTLAPRDADGRVMPDAPLLARGGRYDEFVRRTTGIATSAVGAVVILRSEKPLARPPRLTPKHPSVFVVQIGFQPKIRSLLLLEDLKRAGIPAEQAFTSDSLTEQMRLAESASVPYSLILGQKEFVEKSVIVRDMRRLSQESVPVASLVPFLRRKIKPVR